jgi:hypothetical protein
MEHERVDLVERYEGDPLCKYIRPQQLFTHLHTRMVFSIHERLLNCIGTGSCTSHLNTVRSSNKAEIDSFNCYHCETN